jgi:hypothetical protein
MMHKMVNGKRVDLSDEEKARVEAEWKRNMEKKAQRLEKLKKEKEEKTSIKLSLLSKLETIGLTLEEIETLLK